MAFFSSESRGTPLVDSEMSEAMRRRLGELIGVGWGALAVLLGLVLLSEGSKVSKEPVKRTCSVVGCSSTS